MRQVLVFGLSLSEISLEQNGKSAEENLCIIVEGLARRRFCRKRTSNEKVSEDCERYHPSCNSHRIAPGAFNERQIPPLLLEPGGRGGKYTRTVADKNLGTDGTFI